MGQTYKADFQVDNGTDYDKYNFSTSADQVSYAKNGKETNVQDELDAVNTGMTDISDLIGGHVLRFNSAHYTGSTTITNLLLSLSVPSVCITSTENVTDKPAGKFGVIAVFKFSASRAAAICLCTDGTMFVNNWNASTSAVTGWKEK